MANQTSGSSGKPIPEHPPKLSVEFNLEKEPLKTGQEQPDLRPEEQVRSGLAERTARSARGWLIVALIVMLLIVAGFVDYFGSGIISGYARRLLAK